MRNALRYKIIPLESFWKAATLSPRSHLRDPFFLGGLGRVYSTVEKNFMSTAPRSSATSKMVFVSPINFQDLLFLYAIFNGYDLVSITKA